MRYLPREVLLVTAAVSLAGCATSAPSGPTRATEPPPRLEETSGGYLIQLGGAESGGPVVIAAAADRVWSALVQAYAALGLSADIMNTTTHTYGVNRYTRSQLGGRRTADYLRCAFDGSGPSSAGGYRTLVQIISSLRPRADGSTLLMTEIAASAERVEGTSTGAVRCGSTGELEQRIARLVTERLSAQSP